MKLIVLGSSSSGNCYILKSDTGQSLIIECGIPFKKAQKALDWNIHDCAGVLVSHEHGDHAGHAAEVLKTSVPLYASEGTIAAMKAADVRGFWEPKAIAPMKVHHIGEFRVLPFEVVHDAAQPFGFLIEHEESGRILFATDTAFLPATFPGLNNIMIECNYDDGTLAEGINSGRINKKLRDRIINSHMSFDTCVETIKANDLTNVVNIVLIHPSSDNLDWNVVDDVRKQTNKVVTLARPNIEIEFNKQPF